MWNELFHWYFIIVGLLVSVWRNDYMLENVSIILESIKTANQNQMKPILLI